MELVSKRARQRYQTNENTSLIRSNFVNANAATKNRLKLIEEKLKSNEEATTQSFHTCYASDTTNLKSNGQSASDKLMHELQATRQEVTEYRKQLNNLKLDQLSSAIARTKP